MVRAPLHRWARRALTCAVGAGEWLLEIVPEWQVTLDMAEAFVPRHVARPLLTIDAQLIIAVYLAMERFELLPRRPEPWYSSLWPWTQPVSLMHRFVDMMPAHVPLPTLYWSESDVREACAQFDQPPPRLHNLSNPALQARPFPHLLCCVRVAHGRGARRPMGVCCRANSSCGATRCWCRDRSTARAGEPSDCMRRVR